MQNKSFFHRISKLTIVLILLVLMTGNVVSVPKAHAQTAAVNFDILTIPVGKNPKSIAINEITNRVYVTNYDDKSLSVIDGQTNLVEPPVDIAYSAARLAVNPTTNRIFVGQTDVNQVLLIDGATNTPIANMGFGGSPGVIDLALNPNKNRLYVVRNLDLLVQDCSLNGCDTFVASIPFSDNPSRVAVNPNKNRIYVLSGSNPNKVSIINGDLNTIIATASVGSGANSIAVNPISNKVYITNGTDGSIYVIDGGDQPVVKAVTIPSLSGNAILSAVGINPTTNHIFVATSNGGVFILDGITDEFLFEPILISGTLSGVAANSVTNRVYVTNSSDNSVQVIDDSTSLPPITYIVSGHITNEEEPLVGVTVSAGAAGSVTTDSNGDYILGNLTPGSYTLTPSLSSYTFSPPSLSVTVPPSAAHQDFDGKVPLAQISSDPYSNTPGFHQTEVEPDTFSYGSTIVSAFQVGRFKCGGASNIGWATSTDGGTTWSNGFLSGITKVAGGKYDRVSDPSVAFDAKHNLWLITSVLVNAEKIPGICSIPVVGLDIFGKNTLAIIANTSNDGKNWNNTFVVGTGNNVDKSWIVCDNTPSSPNFGNCYAEWDEAGKNGVRIIKMSVSADKDHQKWSTPKNTANNATGKGGQPLVQPNGTVIVPFATDKNGISAFQSEWNGKTWSWSKTSPISCVMSHLVAGSMHTGGAFPSAEIDGSGKIYVVWQDSRFENGTANDIVMSTSTDGVIWSPIVGIPIDAIGSGVDHFLPGLAVDKSTSGESAHVALTYYYYPKANCAEADCKLRVGFIYSTDGGKTWSSRMPLAGPMSLSWLPKDAGGYMVGDYISTSFSDGTAHPVIEKAGPNSGSSLNLATYATISGIPLAAGSFPVLTTPELQCSP